jgi:16S rRNA (cytosine1402-N4)-methyltransferase
MRMDPGSGTSAAELVNEAGADELAQIISRYGEERHARRIAKAIVAARPVTTTTQLAALVAAAVPARDRYGPRHPATRTFQALRIAVNDELEALRIGLPRALARLVPGGICAVLSYHSLEDRIVKRAFHDAAVECICPPGLPVCGCGREPLVERLTRKPEIPGQEEIEENPRARSARLRAVRRLPTSADGRDADGPPAGPQERA